jgi:hypothetical protein
MKRIRERAGAGRACRGVMQPIWSRVWEAVGVPASETGRAEVSLCHEAAVSLRTA